MRPAGWVVLVWLALGLSGTSRAQVYPYRYRTPSGALIYANAPLESATRWIIIRRVRTRPQARRVPVSYPNASALVSRTTAVPAAMPTLYDGLIRDVADRYGVEYALVKAVIKAESDFNRLAVSPKGARGLMQLMPETAARHMVRDVFVPRDNIEGGCRHLRMLLDRYSGNVPLAVAAYNAGTRTVEDAGGIPAIPETREYVGRVLRYRQAYQREAVDRLAFRR
jgi:soluble lytic murein transglycosylase-like protein